MDGTRCNQFNEAFEKECKLAENGLDHNVSSKSRLYKRDFLLKLRLHPLSLEKPNHLPNLEIIKDKLNLHNINETSYEIDEKFSDVNNFYMPMKAEYSSVKPDYSINHPYYNRMYPYCYPPHVCGGSYSSPKFRMAPHMYCNSLKKTYGNPACYKDFAAEECFIPKRCYPMPEDLWSCYSSDTMNFAAKKSEAEIFPKSRKKLSIIDPVTGKNILESVTNDANDRNTTVQANGVPESDIHSESLGNGYDDYCFYKESMEQDTPASEVSKEVSSNFTNETATNNENYSKEQREEIISCGNDNAESKKEIDFQTKNLDDPTPVDEISDTLNEPSVLGNDAQVFVTDEISSNGVLTQEHDDSSECPIPPPKYPKSGCNFYEPGNNMHHQCDCAKEKLKQLKEKIHSMKQEQQKMAIMQSFLHFKKFQLEEVARNLDEKRIELANFEWNLYNKAKTLQEKEQWLQQNTEKLYEKAMKLAQKEKLLSDQGEIKSSNPWRNSPFRSVFDGDQELGWESIGNRDKSNRFKELGGNEGSLTGQSSASECNSVMSTLDQLERNIVTIEKIHSKKEPGDTFENDKSEALHSSPMKNENVPAEPIGYSKGRRCMPEHLKYWLNKRERIPK